MKNNKYVQQARKHAVMVEGSYTDSTKKSKGKIGTSLKYVGRDLLVTGVGGALTGYLIGRGALIAGAAVSGIGYFMGSQTATMFGAGMMASGGSIALSGTMNGVEKEGMDGVKERFTAFTENFKRQLFLDKIIPKKKKAADDATNGVGEVQYFRHPSADAELQGGTDGLDFTEADRIHDQLEQSARQFAGTDGVDDVNGLDGEVEDRLF